MVCCVPFAWIMLSDVSLGKFGNGLIGVSAFLSNVVFWRQQGYFDDSAELNPILHTWSLAVEEQYYVLFPIFLTLAWRFGKSRVFWLILVFTAISLLLSEWGWRNHATANFYLAPTRAWELFFGSISAFIVQKQGVKKNNYLALLGLGAIIFSILAYDQRTPFPSAYTFLPVLGVVLLVLYAEKETLVARFLSVKVFVSIGLISYSAYLWHQPVFAFFRIYSNNLTLGWLHALVLIIITFSLSYMSWRFVEKPFRNRKFIKKSLLFTLSFAAMLLMFAMGYASKQAASIPEYRLARLLSQNNFVYFENLDEKKFVKGRLLYPLENVNSIVVGSSRVMQINSNLIGENIQSLTVSGASIDDNIAYGLEALAKLKYKNIYISADPWLINKFSSQSRLMLDNELLNYWEQRMDQNLPPVQFLNLRMRDSANKSMSNVLALFRNSVLLSDK